MVYHGTCIIGISSEMLLNIHAAQSREMNSMQGDMCSMRLWCQMWGSVSRLQHVGHVTLSSRWGSQLSIGQLTELHQQVFCTKTPDRCNALNLQNPTCTVPYLVNFARLCGLRALLSCSGGGRSRGRGGLWGRGKSDALQTGLQLNALPCTALP